MLECMILGDSIAVGVATATTKYHRACEIRAHGGDNSSQIQVNFARGLQGDAKYKNTIISMGTNDGESEKRTLHYANLVRERIQGQVWWVLPSQAKRPVARAAIIGVAKIWGDQVIDIEPRQLSPDGIHATPRGYIEIADKALNIIDKD